MGKYLDRFPKVYYSLETADRKTNADVVTDITFPVTLLEKYAQDSKYFYSIIIKDGLKPEDVAYLVYGNVEYHWIILHFNKIVNPQFQWHLSQYNLDNYIAAKYGSISIAQSGVKNYYKIVRYLSSTSDEFHEDKFEIDSDSYANVVVDLTGTTYSLANGESTRIMTDKTSISFYDWEVEENEKRREIKLVQKDYIPQIINSFNSMVKK